MLACYSGPARFWLHFFKWHEIFWTQVIFQKKYFMTGLKDKTTCLSTIQTTCFSTIQKFQSQVPCRSRKYFLFFAWPNNGKISHNLRFNIILANTCKSSSRALKTISNLEFKMLLCHVNKGQWCYELHL